MSELCFSLSTLTHHQWLMLQHMGMTRKAPHFPWPLLLLFISSALFNVMWKPRTSREHSPALLTQFLLWHPTPPRASLPCPSTALPSCPQLVTHPIWIHRVLVFPPPTPMLCNAEWKPGFIYFPSCHYCPDPCLKWKRYQIKWTLEAIFLKPNMRILICIFRDSILCQTLHMKYKNWILN